MTPTKVEFTSYVDRKGYKIVPPKRPPRKPGQTEFDWILGLRLDEASGARIVGLFFPAGWFQQISVGTFTKGLGIAQLWPYILVLAGFTFTFIAIAALALKKQEA